MSDFFSNQPTQVPDLGLVGLIAMLASLVLTFLLTARLYQNQAYGWAIKALQVVQLVAIYSWYALAVGFPLEESLPLYHCRIAMFVVLLCPKPSARKDYFALLGIGGTIAAFVYPVFDPYPFWHVTIFSLIFGHLALWANSWAYLMRHDRRQTLSVKTTLTYTLVLNAFLVLINWLTGGNYGFLAQPPLLNTTNLLVNVIAVTGAVVALILLVQQVYGWVWQHQKIQRSYSNSANSIKHI